MYLRLSFIFFISTVLAACASTQWSSTPTANSITTINEWKIEGKIAFATPNQNQSGNIQWQQKHATFNILLTGPLGLSPISLKSDNRLYILESADTGTIKTTDPSMTFQQEFGWSLPFTALKYWIVGQAEPNSPLSHTVLNDEDELESFQQAGWKIDYVRFETFPHFKLPTKLLISHGDITIKLIIKQWSFPLSL